MKEKKENILKQLEGIDKLADSQIDYTDSKDMGNESWVDFRPFVPHKKPVTIRLDTDVIDYFKSLGKGYQTKINSVLQEYKRHHPK